MEYCPYSELGCNDQFSSQREVNQHLQIKHDFHAKLLIDWINNLKNDLHSFLNRVESLKSENKDLKNEIQSIKESNSSKSEKIQESLNDIKREINELKNQIEKMKCRENDYEKIILKLQETNRSKLTEIHSLKCAISALKNNSENSSPEILKTIKSNTAIETSIKALTEIIENNNAKLIQSIDKYNQLSSDQTRFKNSTNQEITKINEFLQNLNYGEFVWKMSTFPNLFYQEITDKIYFSSDIFLSHKNGYFIQLIMYPKGKDIGLNTHLSVYFSIISGPNDDILPWPIKNEIKISLINQNTGKEHCYKIFKLSNTPKEYQYIYYKPAYNNNNNVNQIFGSEQFIKLSELITNDNLLKNNTIYLKCSLKIL